MYIYIRIVYTQMLWYNNNFPRKHRIYRLRIWSMGVNCCYLSLNYLNPYMAIIVYPKKIQQTLLSPKSTEITRDSEKKRRNMQYRNRFQMNAYIFVASATTNLYYYYYFCEASASRWSFCSIVMFLSPVLKIRRETFWVISKIFIWSGTISNAATLNECIRLASM